MLPKFLKDKEYLAGAEEAEAAAAAAAPRGGKRLPWKRISL